MSVKNRTPREMFPTLPESTRTALRHWFLVTLKRSLKAREAAREGKRQAPGYGYEQAYDYWDRVCSAIRWLWVQGAGKKAKLPSDEEVLADEPAIR